MLRRAVCTPGRMRYSLEFHFEVLLCYNSMVSRKGEVKHAHIFSVVSFQTQLIRRLRCAWDRQVVGVPAWDRLVRYRVYQDDGLVCIL